MFARKAAARPHQGGGTPTATTVAINFTFAGAGDTACSTADLTMTAGEADLYRGLRYKLVCSGAKLKNTTGTMAEQTTLCSASPTVLAATTFTGSGSCTLEAQLLSAPNDSVTTKWHHCDYYATSSATVVAGTANTLTIDLTKMAPGATTPCALEKQLW